mmetsp:Transcript_93915/g.205639  ORF Transcript_93915/g.205639 Transcript_93915/m.205639 type:complete len:94 (-) Transcript_93915:30-311(-)
MQGLWEGNPRSRWMDGAHVTCQASSLKRLPASAQGRLWLHGLCQRRPNSSLFPPICKESFNPPRFFVVQSPLPSQPQQHGHFCSHDWSTCQPC